jgi:anti-sigma B factor antagonist
VALAGKLHAEEATQVRRVFANAVHAGYTEVEVDVGALSSFDVAGLDLLESLQRDCAEQGGLLVLLNPPPTLRRVLGVTGLGWLLHDWRT